MFWHHPLFKGLLRQAAALADFMLPMLHYDPERRATAGEMLRHPWLAGPSGAPVAPPPTAAHSAAEERGYGGSSAGEGTSPEAGPAAERSGGRHANEQRRAFSGRSRSRSASPGGAHRSRCGSP